MNQPAFVTITLLTAENIQVGHVASAPTCTEFRLAIP
jgi:hypothetical protein